MGFFLVNVLTFVVQAQPEAEKKDVLVAVAGILGAKVVLMINGQQRVQAVGSTTPEGITVVDVDSDGAMLKIDGKQEYYVLGGSRVSTTYKEPEIVEERIYKDGSGMYRTTGFINGLPVDFLVDTGATSVAMNNKEARRLGIDYFVDGEPAYVQTASGVTEAYRVKLKTIAVGQIKFSNIDAVVIDGDSPTVVLLGMSFLGRLSVKHKNEVMSLEATF